MKLHPAGSDFTVRCRSYRKELMMPRLVILPLLLAVIAARLQQGFGNRAQSR